jgi:hypothetical protein
MSCSILRIYLSIGGLVEDIDQFQGVGGKVKGETGLECVLLGIVDCQIKLNGGRESSDNGIETTTIRSTTCTGTQIMTFL